MSPESTERLQNLANSLDALIKIYRHLLNIVRREREILIAANLIDLQENNKTKEAMLQKARQLEDVRIQATKSLAESESLPENTRLLDFARHFGGAEGDRLRQQHAVLELLLKRVKEHNQQNEILVNAALEKVTGAIGSVRDSLKDKPTYKKSGSKVSRPADSGQLVSKEV